MVLDGTDSDGGIGGTDGANGSDGTDDTNRTIALSGLYSRPSVAGALGIFKH